MAAPAGRSLELATILRAHAPPIQELGRARGRVVRDLLACRTPLLGGHLQVCDHCGREKPFYNSCRNRHCPKCQSLEQVRWVEAQTRNLLPVPYFHLVFTIPPALHPFFLTDRRRCFALLFEAAIDTLHAVCERRLGAIPGTIAVLHTWSQTLVFHPHIHCIVTGGGLNPQGDRWIAARPAFLVPVRVLSRVFRAKLLERLQQTLSTSSGLSNAFGSQLLRQAVSREWAVYAKAPLAGPEQVLRYLGRYTHRIAIGNERLVGFQNGKVTFRYRDRRRGNASRLLTLEANHFVRRFLLHVLPPGFVRVRHYGLQANRFRAHRIAQARTLLATPAPPTPSGSVREAWQDLYRRILGRDPDRCPHCHQPTLRVATFIPPTGNWTRAP